jgi:peptidoglycan hydrolase-like protein with peptidoglycan-binding domain
MMRVLTDGPIPNRIARGLAFTALSTAAGAASIQALSIINGKDPEDMTKPSLWARAMLKGGAAGYYGELVDAAMRGQQSSADVLQGMAGPAVGVLADVARLATSPVREQFSDDQKYRQSTLGRTAINIAKRNTPNTWYTRLAVDRMFWDKLQTLVDPDYRKSWDRANRNIQKSTGAGFWWPQGGGPERAPDLGTALGH